jgi:hypothetical protein
MISHGHPVIYLPEVPKTLHSQRERGRLQAQGHRDEDNTGCTLLVIHEADSSWAIHGLGAPGVRLSKAEMITLGRQGPGAFLAASLTAPQRSRCLVCTRGDR